MTSSPAPYGHDLDPELHRRLRYDPPVATLDWVRRAAGARRVLSVTALEGGTSSAVHRIVVELGPGSALELVLRRFVLDWVVDEPEAPGNEASVLRHLAGSPSVPAPRLVAADVDGSLTGTPAVLMTARPGRTVWRPSDVDRWLDDLVQTVTAVHRVPTDPALAAWSPYGSELVPPPWSAHPQAWERALTAYEGPRPDSAPVFLHRDFHPGNLLWSPDDAGGERVTGVVDWVSGCVGPAEEDVSHCRLNLAVHAGMPDRADDFLHRWQRATGRDAAYDPYWDLVNAVSCAGPDPDPALDRFVARAAARC